MTVRPANGVRAARIAGGQLVLLFAGTLHQLNPTGALLWTALVEHGSVERASEYVAGRYGMPENRVRADAADFVATLRAAGLVEESR